ncbi:unnamed protein product [Sphagnum tenellum]
MKLTGCLHGLPDCVGLCVITVLFCVMRRGYLKSRSIVRAGPTGTKPSPELQKKPLIRFGGRYGGTHASSDHLLLKPVVFMAIVSNLVRIAHYLILKLSMESLYQVIVCVRQVTHDQGLLQKVSNQVHVQARIRLTTQHKNKCNTPKYRYVVRFASSVVKSLFRLLLKEEEPEKYQARFSGLLTEGLEADDLAEMYTSVHAAISADPTTQLTEKKAPTEKKM